MTKAEAEPPCGILLVDKPMGMSSAHVVAVTKRSLGGVKVGHLGTLDPFASGLLPLCIGEGTKLAPYVNEADKRYRGVIRLGLTTDTLDRTGQVIAEAPVPDFQQPELDRVAASLHGELMQVPPMFSAIKQAGVPMYRLAREGVSLELTPRRVHIHELRLTRVDPERVAIEVHCSKGTYVRSLARDIGQALGSAALLESLVRTAFGGFSLESSVTLDSVKAHGIAALQAPAWLSGAAAVDHLPALDADPGAVRALRAGQQRILASFPPPLSANALTRVLDADGKLVAVLSENAGRWCIDRVFS